MLYQYPVSCNNVGGTTWKPILNLLSTVDLQCSKYNTATYGCNHTPYNHCTVFEYVLRVLARQQIIPGNHIYSNVLQLDFDRYNQQQTTELKSSSMNYLCRVIPFDLCKPRGEFRPCQYWYIQMVCICMCRQTLKIIFDTVVDQIYI